MVNYIELNSHQLRTLNMFPPKHPKMLLGMLVHANGHQTIMPKLLPLKHPKMLLGMPAHACGHQIRMVNDIELNPYQLNTLNSSPLSALNFC